MKFDIDSGLGSGMSGSWLWAGLKVATATIVSCSGLNSASDMKSKLQLC